MKVLGIETSCDETGVAVVDGAGALLGHRLHSQVALHAPYGGVVPELASRDHIARLTPMIHGLLGELGLTGLDIDGVAYTAGPGLIGALLVGASVGRSLAYAWKVPAVAVHHMEGHLLSPMLEDDAPTFPYLALLVSGGHTMLVKVEELGRYELLGSTLDDAAGEAFDKTAKLLGLGYPGGPALAKLATGGDRTRFAFPRPMAEKPGLDFSFSGLKTAVVIQVRELEENGALNDQARADVAASFEQAAVDSLTIKCTRAIKCTGLDKLVVAGGVGANRHLRDALTALSDARGIQVWYPRPEFCTDNGAMIAYAGMRRLAGGQHDGNVIRARARWPIDALEPPVRR